MLSVVINLSREEEEIFSIAFPESTQCIMHEITDFALRFFKVRAAFQPQIYYQQNSCREHQSCFVSQKQIQDS